MYRIDWDGDGIVDETDRSSGPYGASFAHVYTTPGSYTIRANDILTGSAGLDWFIFDKDTDRATDPKDEVFVSDLPWIFGM